VVVAALVTILNSLPADLTDDFDNIWF